MKFYFVPQVYLAIVEDIAFYEGLPYCLSRMLDNGNFLISLGIGSEVKQFTSDSNNR